MAAFTQDLRDEHQELLPHIERIRLTADSIGAGPGKSLRRDIDEICSFLNHHLIPHAHAEDRVLYPVVGDILGTPRATATMSRDHVEINRLAEELGWLRSELDEEGLAPAQANLLRRILYGLYALIKLHIVKEEEEYFAVLDEELTEKEAKRMLEEMEEAAKDVKTWAG